MEYEVYKRWYEWLMAHHRPKVDLIGALWNSGVVACGRAAAAGIDLLSPLTMRVLSYPEGPPSSPSALPHLRTRPVFARNVHLARCLQSTSARTLKYAWSD